MLNPLKCYCKYKSDKFAGLSGINVTYLIICNNFQKSTHHRYADYSELQISAHNWWSSEVYLEKHYSNGRMVWGVWLISDQFCDF